MIRSDRCNRLIVTKTLHTTLLLSALAIGTVDAGGIRERMRPDPVRDTTVTEAQAV
ncbi:hypothetical protein MNBD_GAMMA14-2365, partial [hydrothermal vent metagenome]